MVFFPFATTDRPQVRHEGQTKKSTPLSRKKTTLPSLSTIKRTESKKPLNSLLLRRFRRNPVLAPVPRGHWESKATFNPSAVYGKGKVHLVYRAIGTDDVSSIGYATSKNGFSFTSRSPYPVFTERQRAQQNVTAGPPLSYLSGGGWNGGSEDPRLTLIGDRIYMLYTSFDGWGSVRIALTSIHLDDLTTDRFHWRAPVYISPMGEIHKNWVLFPEKIRGKYAILHAVSPKVSIAYVNDLAEFDGTKHIESVHPNGTGNAKSWDKMIRGAGPAPLKTKHGWLVLYHAMDTEDPNRYKLGAMLLDLKNPTIIRARSHSPILEPDEWYENEGYKSGVVYACGAVIVRGKLLVYYGGADKVACVASAPLAPFLKELLASGMPRQAGAPKVNLRRS